MELREDRWPGSSFPGIDCGRNRRLGGRGGKRGQVIIKDGQRPLARGLPRGGDELDPQSVEEHPQARRRIWGSILPIVPLCRRNSRAICWIFLLSCAAKLITS